MEALSPPPLLVAVDTNFLVKLGKDSAECRECLGGIREHLPSPVIVVLPTVLQELTLLKAISPYVEVREGAAKAEACLGKWGMTIHTLTPVEHGIAEQISNKLRYAGILPEKEKNDGLIIAEAALSQCDFLISSDGHFMDTDKAALSRLLRDSHVKETLPVNPYLIRRVLRK